MTATKIEYQQKGSFFFKRAFVTTFAILTAVSAFITAWMLVWGLTIGGLWSLGRQDGPPNMQAQPSSSQSCYEYDPDVERQDGQPYC